MMNLQNLKEWIWIAVLSLCTNVLINLFLIFAQEFIIDEALSSKFWQKCSNENNLFILQCPRLQMQLLSQGMIMDF